MPHRVRIAYFCMEIGVESSIPTYAGGLGVLSGDTLKAAADLKLPMVGVSLLYKKGMFNQHVQDGIQTESPVDWNPEEHMRLMPEKVEVKIEGRTVKIQAWKYEIESLSGGIVPILYLDTDLEENQEQDRGITHNLYGGDLRYRLTQEIVLGIGGLRMLNALGYVNLEKYHTNEGHAALLTLELLNEIKDEAKVKDSCIFTTHTPVASGHDKFPYDMVQNTINTEVFPIDMIKKYAGNDEFSMTELALNLSFFANGVAKKHAVISNNLFPNHNIKSITNGIHSNTWTCDSMAELYDKYLGDWRVDPFNLRHAVIIPDQEIWDAHLKAKKALIDYVKASTGIELNENFFTIGFARRATAYKRAHLIFSDNERLKVIAHKAGKIQIIFAGKAHPADQEGKDEIKRICDTAAELHNDIKIVFLENYNMEIAKLMVGGVDVWLNTPFRPREASGTSGMKAAHNGVPNFSILDGWWIEGDAEAITGWGIGPKPTEVMLEDKNDDKEDSNDMYEKLEKVILPLFYMDKYGWIKVMKSSIAFNGSYFTTRRMLLQYVAKAYMQ